MCARFTVLSDTPIAAAIAGCAIPLSRNSTIWMRWRCAAGIFHRSAVFRRRTSALLHLTIRSPESDGSSESHLKRGIQPVQPASFQIDPIHAVMEVVLAWFVLVLFGGVPKLFSNPATPPGYVGYLTRGALVGQAH